MTQLSDLLHEDSPTVQAIYAKHKEEGDKQLVRKYLGASIIGHTCDRYLWYCYHVGVKEEIEGRIYRLFRTGELEEIRVVAELELIGCEVHAFGENGEQFEVSALDDRFKGHLDGAVLGIPEAPKTWHVLECKTHNDKSFNKLKKEGVYTSKPMHYAQMQVYMHLTGMTRALYFAVNKNTDELYTERVKYNNIHAEAYMRRAKDIIESEVPLDRCSSRPDYYECKYCSARELCWGEK
jgi:hypothetical protein